MFDKALGDAARNGGTTQTRHHGTVSSKRLIWCVVWGPTEDTLSLMINSDILSQKKKVLLVPYTAGCTD
jgi:hypothetical protein